MLLMLLQTNPSILEQLGSRAALIHKELERREKAQQMTVRLSFSVRTLIHPSLTFFNVVQKLIDQPDMASMG